MERNAGVLRRLVQMAMRRDELARLAMPLLGEVTRFARWLVTDVVEAEDIVQETVARALAAAGTLNDPRRIRPWLFRIARNVTIDRRRARAAADRLVVLAGGFDDLGDVELPAGDRAVRYERAEIEAALAELPELARSALLLSDLWGLDRQEISDVLDVPLGTVKSRVARARARVAILLERGPDAASRRKGESA